MTRLYTPRPLTAPYRPSVIARIGIAAAGVGGAGWLALSVAHAISQAMSHAAAALH